MAEDLGKAIIAFTEKQLSRDGCAPDVDEIAEELSISEAEVEELLDALATAGYRTLVELVRI